MLVARRFAAMHGISLFGAQLLALIFACALASCSQLPSQPKIKAFADATSSAADVLKASIDLNGDLAQHSGEDIATEKYLGSKPYEFPPKDTLSLPQEALKPRLELIAAIGNYAQSLAKAADPGTIQDLQASATALASTLGQDIAPLIGSAAVPLISPVAKLIGFGVGLTVASNEAVEIREVMRRTHPILIQAADELKNSVAVILRNDRSQYNHWIIQKRILLDRILKNYGDTAGTAITEFRSAAAQERTYAAKIVAVSKYSRLLDSLVKAHEGLINPTDNSDADLTNFLALVQQLAGIISAVKPAG